MAAKQDFLSLVDLGGKIRRPALVGMQFHHQGAVRPADVLGSIGVGEQFDHAPGELSGLIGDAASGNTSRGNDTFLTSEAFMTTDVVALRTPPEKKFHTNRPDNK